jgi:ubiquinone biosynthesis protein UbiJ
MSSNPGDGGKFMFEALAVPAINRLLRVNTWALDKLKAQAGKTAWLSSPPFELKLTVSELGTVRAAMPDASADVVISVTPGVLLRLAARDETAWTGARISGDMEFASAIDYVRRNLVWDFEEDLSSIFGDIAAHRVAQVVRELDRWGRSSALNVAQALAEYGTHERPLFASAPAVDDFNREVDDLRDRLARLEKRIERLQRGTSDRAP